MGGWGFRDKQDAIALERLAKRERSKPNKTEDLILPGRLQNTLRAIVAVPLETVPAASIAYGGEFVLGKAQAYIYNRDQDTPDDLIQFLHTDGSPVEETIYNLCSTEFVRTGGTPGTNPGLDEAVFVTQDLDGDYYITHRCDTGGVEKTVTTIDDTDSPYQADNEDIEVDTSGCSHDESTEPFDCVEITLDENPADKQEVQIDHVAGNAEIARVKIVAFDPDNELVHGNDEPYYINRTGAGVTFRWSAAAGDWIQVGDGVGDPPQWDMRGITVAQFTMDENDNTSLVNNIADPDRNAFLSICCTQNAFNPVSMAGSFGSSFNLGGGRFVNCDILLDKLQDTDEGCWLGWFQRGVPILVRALVAFSNGAGSARIMVRCQGDKFQAEFVDSVSSKWSLQTPAASIPASTPVHWALRKPKGLPAKFYIDGVLSTTATGSDTSKWFNDMDVVLDSGRVSAWRSGGSELETVGGNFDDIRIVSEAISSTTIAAIAQGTQNDGGFL